MPSDSHKDIYLLPFVCDAGAQLRGTERGPAEAKKRGLQKQIEAHWPLDPESLHARYAKSYGSLPPIGSDDRREVVLKACRDMADSVEKAVHAGALPVTLGGDHSMAMGSIAGFARAKNAQGKIGVIWVDAHADLHTPDTTPSNALHGMPLAALLGLGDEGFCGISGGPPVLKPEHFVYIGLRSTELEEEGRIASMGIQAFRMPDVQRIGVQAAFEKAFDLLKDRVEYLILSIDLDAFDPSDAPAVGSPEPGGLRYHEVAEALKNITRRRHFDMIEIAEYNPTLPGADQTYTVLEAVLKAALGR